MGCRNMREPGSENEIALISLLNVGGLSLTALSNQISAVMAFYDLHFGWDFSKRNKIV